MDILANVPEFGYYVSMPKLIFLVVLAVPWLIVGPWISKDTSFVHTSRAVWSSVFIGAGSLGVLIWLLMPLYIVGVMVYIVLSAAAIGAYVVHRNSRVPQEYKVLTGEHLSSVFSGKKGEKKVQVTQRVKVYTHDSRVVPPPDETASAEVKESYNLAQALLYDVLFYRASEADLLPVGGQARLRLVIDGVVTEREPMEIPASEAIVQFLKPCAGMSAEERRRPQQGKITVDIANSPVDFIVTTAGSTGGQRMQFKIVQEFVQTQIEVLGMSADVLGSLKTMTAEGNGLVIISGRSGSGVTSTLYSILRAQDAFMKQLVTMEDKPIVDLENVTQVAYGDASKLPGMLATTLRRDPDVLMLDHCEDPQVASQLLPFLGRKTVIVGMSAKDSFDALGKWIRLCGDAAEAVADLRGILCQMLVRKLCPTCRESYHPDPRFLAKVNLPAQKIGNFYRPPTTPLVDEKGQPYTCPTCQGNGYFGRTAVFELLEMTDDIRSIISGGGSMAQVQAGCRKKKMLYLQEQALRKVMDGVTSIQEVIRVTQQPKK